MTVLPPIPVLVAPEGGILAAAKAHPDKARALARAAADTYGLVSRVGAALALPLVDRQSRRWLKGTHNPFFPEIEEIERILAIQGVMALNICFEWGCTSLVRQKQDAPILARVMDWGFPLLGETMIVLKQQGDGREFFNITWPGLSGMFQGLAPRRFAAAINQAPMRGHGRTIVGDWMTNRIALNTARGLPPAHLLRLVFEQAPDYAQAKQMLSEREIACPAIFTLSGTRVGEGCIIERTENTFAVREMSGGQVSVANHFESAAYEKGQWHARPIDSPGRRASADTLRDQDFTDDFRWFKPPIANVNSRLVFEADAATGRLKLMGTKGAEPVTQILRLG